MLLEAYFDESETHGLSLNMLVVAGYLFKHDQARKFSREAEKLLKRFGISHFHQTDCANGRGEYANIPLENRIRCQNEFIALIKRRSLIGISAAIQLENYDKIMSSDMGDPSAYACALFCCFVNVRIWLEENNINPSITYYIESGNNAQSEANEFIFDLISSDNGKEVYRYFSHAFVDKKKTLPLQAADMLAWYGAQEHRRYIQGISGRRRDFAALARKQDMGIFFKRRNLIEVRDILRAHRARK